MNSEKVSPSLSSQIKAEARRLGFDLCRITAVDEAPHAEFFERWIESERAGEMQYLARNVEKRRSPRLLADDQAEGSFQSLIVLAVNHYQFPLSPEIIADPSRGIIASYAWGDDYHEIIKPALYELDGFIREQSGRQSQAKCLVDTGPVLERDWAHRVGLGFTGKNCCSIHPQLGSWLLLATILVPEKLATDPLLQSVPLAVTAASADQHVAPVAAQAVLHGLPPEEEYGRWEMTQNDDLQRTLHDGQMVTCGRCTRCLDACPTDAFVGPYHLDPQRCISYWTIESRSPIPLTLRSRFGNRIFGCDICQEVCPWNQRLESRTPIMAGLAAQSERIAPPLLEGFLPEMPYWLNQNAFSQRFRRSPIKRAKRAGMLRNVCVALGNWASPQTVEALTSALQDDDPLPRGHAAWALGRVLAIHRHEPCQTILLAAQAQEAVSWVREEIALALGGSSSVLG